MFVKRKTGFRNRINHGNLNFHIQKSIYILENIVSYFFLELKRCFFFALDIVSHVAILDFDHFRLFYWQFSSHIRGSLLYHILAKKSGYTLSGHSRLKQSSHTLSRQTLSGQNPLQKSGCTLCRHILNQTKRLYLFKHTGSELNSRTLSRRLTMCAAEMPEILVFYLE